MTPGPADHDLAGLPGRERPAVARRRCRSRRRSATPTEPGLRSPGGSGFEAIWWLASVMPYASSIGTP